MVKVNLVPQFFKFSSSTIIYTNLVPQNLKSSKNKSKSNQFHLLKKLINVENRIQVKKLL